MTGSGVSVARTATLIAAGAQTAGVAALVTVGLGSGGAPVDRLRALPVAAVYLSTAVLAVASLRGRSPLLLAAATSALVLAIFPFSLHSFVLGPLGVVYLGAYAGLSRGRQGGSGALAAVAACALLAVAGLLVLSVHAEPACYTRYASGEVTVDRTADSVTSGHLDSPVTSVIVERGCTSDTVVWWEAAASLILSTGVVVAGLRLVPRRYPHEQTDEGGVKLPRMG